MSTLRIEAMTSAEKSRPGAIVFGGSETSLCLAQETCIATVILPGESATAIVRGLDRRILQELEAKIEAKLAKREANWLRGLYLLRVHQWESDVDIL